MTTQDTIEGGRLAEARTGTAAWKRWGPYLSDRQWGTVREDYSPHGTAWDYFPHDHARSRAYRWGEDGIGGISDDQQRLCFALALWNGRDPILKERYFGLTGNEGNHGEDVKEYYYYLDATPTASYLKMLYKYPQSAFPYHDLVETNLRRGREAPEYELIDTGIFDEDRYFDVVVEYAKAGPDDILVRISATNHGPEAADLHLLPHLWFRNTWSWASHDDPSPRPLLRRGGDDGSVAVVAQHPELGRYVLSCDGSPTLLFTENETNNERLFEAANRTPYVKDDAIFAARRAEADAFYASLQPPALTDERLVQWQALAGLVWSKQLFYFDVQQWLEGDPGQPPPPESRKHGRNREWGHVNAIDVMSMPDAWEYPWFAAWDLAFHCLPFALIDPDFAKHQLLLLGCEWYQHPNGQVPAYEWAFGDVNPLVVAWAAWRVYKIDQRRALDADEDPLDGRADPAVRRHDD